MVRKSALVVLVVTLVCAAMLAVPTATATTEPAVTFFVQCRLRTRGSRSPARPARASTSSVAAGRRISMSSTEAPSRTPSTSVAFAHGSSGRDRGSASAPTSTIADGSSTRSWAAPCPSTRAGFASSSPWPAAPRLPRGGHRCDRPERRGGDRPPRRAGRALVALGPCRTGAWRARERRPARRSPPALSRCSSPRGDSASAVRAAVSAS